MKSVKRSGHIVAMSGGGFSMEPENPLLDDFALSLADKPKPRVAFVPTASGDADRYIDRFQFCFRDNRCVPTVITLFTGDLSTLRERVLGQDVIYVGGGSTVNLLALWRTHGLDAHLREAWQHGAVLCGVSAGAICWFEGYVTDSFGPLAGRHDGLGFLRGGACPHYDGEADRRPTLHRLVRDGFSPTLALDDGVAAHFRGEEFVEAVASRPGAGAYRVRLQDGEVIEEKLPVRRLRAL